MPRESGDQATPGATNPLTGVRPDYDQASKYLVGVSVGSPSSALNTF
ncbi:hypothetical protein [Paludibaculum fermentans]|uniref:Uncharacterized protein n=1 Tax=Paludibaculum fermentans TaxID=1473598 RepID=A0A7S7NYU0_PALFE|nr:hypothetical protein [Paludibaculum fermentans]QOY92293.1 hypothetical protein IRI77_07350 [Paludibaculum fermentans]